MPAMDMMSCPGMAVPMEVMQHVVRVESSYNPYAIGVVGGRLVRQPANLAEALSTVAMLERRGYNFSVGLAQVNRFNLAKYGVGSYETAFDPCTNLKTGSRILAECYYRSGRDWGKSFSCYYSGDFITGYRHGYVQKIYASMRAGRPDQRLAIPVAGIASPTQRRIEDDAPPAARRVMATALTAGQSDAQTPTGRPLRADPADVFAARSSAIADAAASTARALLQAQPAPANATVTNNPAIDDLQAARGGAGRPIPDADAPGVHARNPDGNEVVHLADLQHPAAAAQAAGAMPTATRSTSGGDAAFVF